MPGNDPEGPGSGVDAQQHAVARGSGDNGTFDAEFDVFIRQLLKGGNQERRQNFHGKRIRSQNQRTQFLFRKNSGYPEGRHPDDCDLKNP